MGYQERHSERWSRTGKCPSVSPRFLTACAEMWLLVKVATVVLKYNQVWEDHLPAILSNLLLGGYAFRRPAAGQGR